MRIQSVLFLFTLLTVLPVYTAVAGSDSDGTPVKYSPDRADLTIADSLWSEALSHVNYADRTLGYTGDEMSHYRGSDHVLASIEGLFRDVQAIPAFGGRYGDFLLKDPDDVAFASYLGYSLLDVRAGRGVTSGQADDWGVDWLEKGISPNDALNEIFALGREKGYTKNLSLRNKKEWDKLPLPLMRFVVRLLVAGIEAKPYLLEAFDEEFLKTYFEVNDLNKISHDELYSFVSLPWNDSAELIPKESFDALGKIDLGYLAFASQIYLKLTQDAVKELIESEYAIPDEFKICEFWTMIGRVGIFGSADNVIDDNFSLIVELGGNDVYKNKKAVPLSFEFPIGTLIDLSGNDIYGSKNVSESFACGNHGIGVIYDLSGNDIYSAADSGLGCAWYGTGVLVDSTGNDQYNTHGGWGQGAAHAGLGMLIDKKGNDKYYCMKESQAFGSTLGVGILLDVDGNDTYLADPEGNLSAPFHNNTVSFAQGTGFGRRADFGDGHSLGGGFGILVEGNGDDSYEGGVYCQGAGYWWAMGILEDRGGNDQYKNVWYSLGSAPHFAIGSCVDLKGNDKYNIGFEEKLMCQTQGCARDGSIAVFIDGSGDDEYYHTNRCAGSGDLNSIALFWDRTGDDIYNCNRDRPYILDLTYGDAPYYEPFGNFRDDVESIGLFFDTGGNDEYNESLPDEVPENFVNIKNVNNSEWSYKSGPRFWGWGVDRNLYLDEPEDIDPEE